MPVIQNPTDKVTVSIDLPREVHAMVVDGLAGQGNWTEKVRDQQTGLEIDNPVKKIDAARSVLVSFISQVVKQSMVQVSQKTATESANTTHSAVMREIQDGGLISFTNL